MPSTILSRRDLARALSVALPVLDNVAAIDAEVVPVAVFGKARDAVSEATGADPAAMEIELLVTAVDPPATADNVYVPVEVNIRLLNVATPFTAFTANVPPTPVGLELIFTCAEDRITRSRFDPATAPPPESRPSLSSLSQVAGW